MTADQPFTCATCDAIIAHRPVFYLGLTFCCAGCAADGPCMCSYDPLDEGQKAARAPRRTDRAVRARLIDVDPVDVAPPIIEPPLPATMPSPVAAQAPVAAQPTAASATAASAPPSVAPSSAPARDHRPVVLRHRPLVSTGRADQR
jgi:hypothetical protein